MSELAAELEARHGVGVDPASLSRFLCKAGLSYKKNPAGRGARTLGRRQAPRRLDTSKRQPGACAPCRIGSVFIDETSTTTKLSPAARLEPLKARAAARCGPVRPLAEPDLHCRSALPWADGPMAPRRRNGSDSLRRLYRDPARSHLAARRRRHSRQLERARVRQGRCCAGRAGRLVPVSPRPTRPTSNPIEMAFAKLKAHLRAARARTYDALWRAVGDICSLFEPRECWNFLRHAGYASD